MYFSSSLVAGLFDLRNNELKTRCGFEFVKIAGNPPDDLNRSAVVVARQIIGRKGGVAQLIATSAQKKSCQKDYWPDANGLDRVFDQIWKLGLK